MTVHKLSVGDGYSYLTKQVAGGDVQRAPGQSAADYYTQAGNPEGRWLGSGLGELDLVAGSAVREEQMRNLFGSGIHPDTEQQVDTHLAEHLKPGMSKVQRERVFAAAKRSVKLGQKFPEYETLEPFADRVAKRLGTIASETGRAATPAEITKVKREEASRQRTSVAGYDLVFSPVKSVSILFGLHPDEQVRSEVKAAHDAAVASVIDMLEKHAAFTRSGVGGVAQIETKGLIAAAFDHFDSRSGDPDLHTHLAVVNKIQGVDGKWRSLDGSALYALGVAASETYNSAVEAELTTRLGVAFTDRPGPARNGRPVREIDGIDPDVVKHFSSRRGAIEHRYAELRSDYRTAHGREPDAKTAYELAQRATLETRGAKEQIRSLEQMRTDWTADLTRRFGPESINHIAATVLRALEPVQALEAKQVSDLAERVVNAIGEERATWTRWNVHAETMRQLRAEHVFTTPEKQGEAAEQIVATALGEGTSVHISMPTPVEVPEVLRRSDGVSVFEKHEAHRFTSQKILDAETRLVDAASTATVYSASAEAVRLRLEDFERQTDRTLDAGQRRVVEAFATDDRLLAVGIGPAGSGKTTAMRAYKDALDAEGRRLIGLAPSAKAAKVLEHDLGIRCDTVDKFLWDISPGNLMSGPELVDALRHTEDARAGQARGDADQSAPLAADLLGLRPGDVVLVDEASMAGTLNLDRVTAIASYAGAQVRLLGDTHQLGAVASGGALRLIAAKAGATELDELHRFTDPAFAAASLQMRVGDGNALDYFERRGRLVGGTQDAMADAIYAAWKADIQAGKRSLMLAHRGTVVADLAAKARADRVEAGEVRAEGVALHDGNTAGRGDWIVTRNNDSRLRYCRGKDTVRNGETWTVMRTFKDGSMKVKNHNSGAATTLPAWYTTEHVELAYASTIDRSQGMTIDTAHPLLTPGMNRNALYVAATRAAETTTLYAVTHTPLPAAPDDRTWRPGWDPDATAAREIAEQILATEPDDLAATEAIEQAAHTAESLATLVPQYQYTADRIAAAHYRELVEQQMKPLLSEDAWKDLQDNGFGALARTLAVAETQGWKAEQLLALACRRSLDDANSPTAVLTSRIQKLTTDHPAPPPGMQPEARDVAYYAQLIKDHHPRLRLDLETALNPPAANLPATGANTVAPQPNAERYRAELADLLGDDRAARIGTERAWPAVVGALTRAEDTGQHSAEALQRAVAQRGLDGLDSSAEILAWRLDRQTRLIAHDPTHTGQAWPAIAWTLKAWETHTGSDAAYLVDTLAPGRGLDNLAIAIAHSTTETINRDAKSDNPTGLPWLHYPAHVLTSDAAEPDLREFATNLARAIHDRTDTLAETSLAKRPEWTHTFGPEPDDPTAREALEAALRLAAAHRDQHDITDTDPANPLGPYPTTGRTGNREWWASAAAILTQSTVDETGTPTGLSAMVEQHLAATIARDLYNAIPETERTELHAALAAKLDPLTATALERDPETIASHPSNATALTTALAETGHLTPQTAADLRIIKLHLDENLTQKLHSHPSNKPELGLLQFGGASVSEVRTISGPRLV
ncbi:MobF family relaxase [Glycomyces salinus]|uniref:MobF family relaxase n=1 Tax=Glycomyces salinus TaxID=980294 RepID=UPI0018ECE886|nr:MobF family relaxase [Glycomyces salinus]